MRLFFIILISLIMAGICSGQNPQEVRPQENTSTASADNEFKNMRTFILSGNLVVPKGVKRVMVEVWGAGGGGTVMGGGGGGAYGKAFIDVAEGNTLIIDVGKGGSGNLTRAGDGEASSVSYKTAISAAMVMFRVSGGAGFDNSVGNAGNGIGGKAAEVRSVSIGFTYLPGEDGSLYQDFSRQSGNTSIVTRYYGRGGNAANAPYTGGRGSIADFGTTGSTTNLRLGSEGKVPGGGGGAAHAQRGYNGGGGMVIVYY